MLILKLIKIESGLIPDSMVKTSFLGVRRFTVDPL